MTMQVVGHEAYLPTVCIVSCFSAYGTDVLMVHAYDEVETVEVAAVQLLCTAVEVIAVTGTALAHSAVR